MDSGDAAGIPSARVRVWATAAAVAVLSALPYLAGGVSGSFIAIDDGDYIYDNPRVRDGLTRAGVRWALTSFHASNWHPLTWISHMADISLFGLDARGHHLTSVLIHALAAALLCVALHRMTGALGRSAFVAALFGVHPLHVESVAWAAERKDVLAGLLFAFVLLAYAQYARRPRPLGYLAVVALLALGLTAKPMLVTAPCVLLLLDFWPLGRSPGTAGAGAATAHRIKQRHLLAEKVPLLALCAGASWLTLIAQRTGGTLATLERHPPGHRLANALVSYAVYLRDAIWPSSPAVYYPHPASLPSPAVIAAALLVLAALSWVAWAGRRRRPFLATGWLWYLGMLVPVLGLVQVGGQARADRYTYLPLLGVFLMLAWSVPPTSSPRRRLPPRAIVAVTILLLLAGLSAAHLRHWRDSETLFRRALAVTTGNWLIHNNLGAVLLARDRLDEAAEQFQKSLQSSPRAENHNNLGMVLFRGRQIDGAIEQYRQALRLRPDYAAARHNLGLALAALGRTEEATGHFREALRLNPGFFEAALALGRASAELGRPTEAAGAYREALRLRPQSVEARSGLAAVLRR